MPIPDFQSLMLPVLRFVSDGKDHSTAEMRERIAGDLKLTPDELGQKLKSGNTGLFANRLAWAVAKLKEAEILAASGRGVYRMTDRGKALLEKNPAKITIKTLLGLRPLERVFVVELLASGLAVELPVDFDASAIGPSVPGLGLAFQNC